ncbi:MAG: NADH-quinone oxidoreductase subunit H [Cytophagaceae bacterium]|nr:NADH-quinone oxidoreductase subunit H [Cytophagaceae bacterium]MBL0323815.1 NADH-quinone oxidoreductase subunit H [Cytophagaceae bacterium]
MYLPILIFVAIVGANVIISVYLERKLSAFIQDRLGPMEVGKWGLLQLIADLMKLFQKEDIIPATADKKLFKLAPYVIFGAIFTGYALLPVNPVLQGSGLQTGIFLLMGVVSLDIVGILMAGWASNNKYSLLGSMRSIAQIISYEIPLGLSVLAVVITTSTLNLQEMSFQQGIFSESPNYLFGIKKLGIETTQWGGFLTWNIFRSPVLFIAFIIFFIAGLAEANRAPFDLPEAESELIAGFHTEYSGFRWAILFLAEYGMMLLMAFLAAILFFGGWNTPLPNIGPLKLADFTTGTPGSLSIHLWGAFWLIAKAYFGMLVQMWVRWTFPRLRIDQLIYLCWKVLTPIALIIVVIASFWRVLMVL